LPILPGRSSKEFTTWLFSRERDDRNRSPQRSPNWGERRSIRGFFTILSAELTKQDIKRMAQTEAQNSKPTDTGETGGRTLASDWTIKPPNV
jgi:hypothetical protein